MTDFKIYIRHGVAHLVAISRRANTYMIRHFEDHRDYKPAAMDKFDIENLIDEIHRGNYTAEMIAI